MKKEVKAGDVIVIPNKYIKEIKSRSDEVDGVYAMIRQMSVDVSKLHFELWEFMSNIIPEIKGKLCTLDKQNMTLMVKRDATELEISDWEKDKYLRKWIKEEKAGKK